mmetsp:Transcript_6559/g.9532  ORF Transcript_6559/g.9532 Transcript_6559/m.9532 type:complete len:256 (-) Transcript_6559:378-1145(-)|eukprot:CAMPEP_0117424962 /NCGR_PEP_ID=MMETSP0758-20121206/5300_1 /TAXON_ID=63605 /ORGANISM="Percolomonas cosmopolitus, Strain AE-1 (ATCC 50343)" /LENGTH=255 /DNA_ID=CAMNT_0005209103 /DNA_START=1 /DNA_END=768 /DNA_ORIENTATION=-
MKQSIIFNKNEEKLEMPYESFGVSVLKNILLKYLDTQDVRKIDSQGLNLLIHVIIQYIEKIGSTFTTLQTNCIKNQTKEDYMEDDDDEEKEKMNYLKRMLTVIDTKGTTTLELLQFVNALSRGNPNSNSVFKYQYPVLVKSFDTEKHDSKTIPEFLPPFPSEHILMTHEADISKDYASAIDIHMREMMTSKEFIAGLDIKMVRSQELKKRKEQKDKNAMDINSTEIETNEEIHTDASSTTQDKSTVFVSNDDFFD